jgi:hypothetical protein
LASDEQCFSQHQDLHHSVPNTKLYRRHFSVIDAIFGTMLVDDKLRPERGNRARALQPLLNSVLDPDVQADMRQPSTSAKGTLFLTFANASRTPAQRAF